MEGTGEYLCRIKEWIIGIAKARIKIIDHRIRTGKEWTRARIGAPK